jgi:hypothetical protein
LFQLFAAGVVDTGGNLPPALLTPAANLPPVSLTPVANLPSVSTTQGELVEKFAAGVVDAGGKFAAGVCRWHRRQICRRYRWHRWQICHQCQQHKGNWWKNLPPVSLMPVANLPLVCVVDTGGNLPPVLLTPVANLPPVSLTPVVHLYLGISPWIFKKILNDPNSIIRGLGEGDSWKKPEAKNLVTLSL